MKIGREVTEIHIFVYFKMASFAILDLLFFVWTTHDAPLYLPSQWHNDPIQCDYCDFTTLRIWLEMLYPDNYPLDIYRPDSSILTPLLLSVDATLDS